MSHNPKTQTLRNYTLGTLWLCSLCGIYLIAVISAGWAMRWVWDEWKEFTAPPYIIGMYQNDSEVVDLTDARCNYSLIVVKVPNYMRYQFRAAVITSGTSVREGCWHYGNRNSITLIDDRGTLRELPIDQIIPRSIG